MIVNNKNSNFKDKYTRLQLVNVNIEKTLTIENNNHILNLIHKINSVPMHQKLKTFSKLLKKDFQLIPNNMLY